jgi:glycosyltransferase involved in cell wall biosynthesis
MKILQVSHGLPPKEKAGVELYTFYLSQALTQLNHTLSIFCREEAPDREEFSSTEEIWRGLRVTRVVNNLTRISDPRIFYDNPFFDQAFLKVLQREKPDLIHFQHFIALSARLIRIAREEGIPIVLTLHDFFILCHRIHLLKEDHRLCPGPLYGLECVSCLGCPPPSQDFRTRFILRMKDRLPFSVIKWTKRFLIPTRSLGERGYEAFHRYRFFYEILKCPDLLLAPSRFVQDVYLKYYPVLKPKMMILPLGIPPIQEEGFHRSRPPALDGKIRFCYFGNILPTKGLHILLEAFKGLPQTKAHLTIFGSRTSWNETYYDHLKQQASGLSVDFRGPFQRENLSAALQDQEVVILPSICYESFSFVIREANCLGYPVIASRIGAIPEAMEDGKNGFLFEPGNSEDLKKCLLRFIEKPALVQTMTTKMKGVKLMDEHAFELAEIYQRMIGKNR